MKDRKLFDMEACLKEKEGQQKAFPSRQTPALNHIVIAGATELNRFSTRVALTEVMRGRDLTKAVETAKEVSRRKETH